METITSRRNEIVRLFRDASTRVRRDDPRLLLDGIHLVQEARDARLPLTLVAFSAQALDADHHLATLARSLEVDKTRVVAVTASVMEALSPVRSPSGVVAIASRPASEPEAML